MIVEPPNGYPTKADREYAIVQSEFYTKLDPQKRKADGQPLYVLDGERVRAKAPTYTVFNGRYNGMVVEDEQAHALARFRRQRGVGRRDLRPRRDQGGDRQAPPGRVRRS